MEQTTELDVTSNDAIIGIKKYTNILLPFLHEDLLNKMENTDYESEITKVIQAFCNKLVYFFSTVDDLKRYDDARKEEEENLKKIEEEKRDVGLTAENLFKLSIKLLSDMIEVMRWAPNCQEIENCLTVESFKKSPIDMVKLIDSTAEQLWGELYSTGNMPMLYFNGNSGEAGLYNRLKFIRKELICFSIRQDLENQAKLKITSENMKYDLKIFDECFEIIYRLLYGFMPDMLGDKAVRILISVENDLKLMEETSSITLLLKITYNLHVLMQCVRQELMDYDADTCKARNLLNDLNLMVVELAQQFVATDDEVPNYLITSEIQNALNSINNGKYLTLDDEKVLKNLRHELLSYLKKFSKNAKPMVKLIRKCKNVRPLKKNKARAAW